MRIQKLSYGLRLIIPKPWIYIKMEVNFTELRVVIDKQFKFYQTAVLEKPLWNRKLKRYIENSYNDEDIPF